MKKVRRVLIIRGSAIGDVLHATPLAAALKEAYPHLEITWITEEICGDIVLGNPNLQDVIVIPRSRWKKGRLRSPRVWAEYFSLLKSLRSRHFDLTLDLQGYAKSALLVLAAGAPRRLGWWRMRDGADLVSQALPRRSESLHRVDWFLDVGRALGAACDNVRFSLAIPDSARTSIDTMLRDAGIDPNKPYAVINQAAGDPARRWSAESYGQVAWELADRYYIPSILIGVSNDAGPNETIIRRFQDLSQAHKQNELEQHNQHSIKHSVGHSEGDDAEKKSAVNSMERTARAPINFAGKTDLKQLFALIDRCAIQISGDTGSLHIAAALNRPVVALFGSSDPVHAGPWGQMQSVIAHRNLCKAECTVRRCAYHTTATAGDSDRLDDLRDGTVRSHSNAYCLNAITPDEVMALTGRLLASNQEKTSIQCRVAVPD